VLIQVDEAVGPPVVGLRAARRYLCSEPCDSGEGGCDDREMHTVLYVLCGEGRGGESSNQECIK
jgi:hypothetical protein